MSMYLSNSDVGPTGAEPGEFVDFPPSVEELRLHLGHLHRPQVDDPERSSGPDGEATPRPGALAPHAQGLPLTPTTPARVEGAPIDPRGEGDLP